LPKKIYRNYVGKNMNKKDKQSGFTLLELMTVMTIIAIMASIAMPNYQDRIIRSQVQEALELCKTIKPAITEYYTARNKFPLDNAETNVPRPEYLIGNYVTGISLQEGAIHIKLGNKINAHVDGKVLTLRPAIVSANPSSPIAWLCGYSQPVEGMKAVGENRTNIPENYLPLECRAW
jgi:type IV pilus assembly protein PilA